MHRAAVLALMAALAPQQVLGDLSKLAPPAKGKVRLYLCRHGQTDWNAEKKIQGSVDRDLNALGERQALLIGEALKAVPVTLVAASPLRRAFRTANLAMDVACPGADGVRIENGLREMHFGVLEGAVAAESELYAATNAAWASGQVDRAWPEGESPKAVETRGRLVLAGLGLLGQPVDAVPPHTHVAVVCHGRFNKILLSSILGRGVDQCGAIQQGNCCINVVDIDVSAPVDAPAPTTVVVLDSRDHLAGLDQCDADKT